MFWLRRLLSVLTHSQVRRVSRKLLGFIGGSGLVSVLGLLLVSGTTPPSFVGDAAAAPQIPADPQTAPMAPAAPAPAASPADQALQLLTLARQSYQSVQDYVCTFIKQERINGQLMPENVITMQVRSQPFSVHCSWLAPKNLVGQEACYVAGRNNGMMRAHPVGLLGVAGFISVDPHDPRAMKENRHPITEAGIGHLIDRVIQNFETERRFNATQIQISEYTYNNRPCTRFEAVHPNRSAGQFYAYRCVLFLDKETHLPIRFEAYDWPRQGGPAEGDLLECYSYVNIRFNVKLGEEVFNH